MHNLGENLNGINSKKLCMMVWLTDVIQIIFMHIQNRIVFRFCWQTWYTVDTTKMLPVIFVVTNMQMTYLFS